MRLSRIDIYTSLLAVYLAYSTIANFSVYYIGLVPTFFIFLLLCSYGILFRSSIINKCRTNDSISFILGWGFIMLTSIVVNGVLPRFRLIYDFIICLFILSLNLEIQKSVFRKYVWFISILFLLSALEYVIYIVTGKGIVIATVKRVTEVKEGMFYHYLFNIITVHDILFRFKGLCSEPGNMGAICAFMLFATWRIKSMKYPFFIFLTCGLISLSLAFYVVLFVFLLTNLKPNFKNITAAVVISGTFLYLFGDNFERKIVDRLTTVDNIEELDNRTTETFDRYFSKAFDDGDLWFGVGSNNLPPKIVRNGILGEGGNAGAKKWIFQYGIIILNFIIHSFFCLLLAS